MTDNMLLHAQQCITQIKKYCINNKLKSCIVGCSTLMILRHILLKMRRRFYSLPPGPNGIPFFGCFLFRINLPITSWINPYYSSITLTKGYGPIVMFSRLPHQHPICLISGSSLSKQMLKVKPKNNSSHVMNRGLFNSI